MVAINMNIKAYNTKANICKVSSLHIVTYSARVALGNNKLLKLVVRKILAVTLLI